MADIDTPIRNGFLENTLDGNSQDVVNLLRLVVGGATGSYALHLSPGATPTGSSDGISFGDDVQLHRSNTDTLKLVSSGTTLFDMSSGRITNVADPVGANDVANKTWAESTFATGSHNHDASTVFNAGTVPHEYGGLEADVSAYAGVAFISGGSTSEIKYNLAGTTAPGSTDDSGAGYAIGSRWVDVSNDKEYVCTDATVSAAVWTETTSTGGGGAAELSDLSDVNTAPTTQNFFLATPDGATGNYGGRAIVEDDLPGLSAAKITSGTLVHEQGGLEADVSAYDGHIYISSGTTVELKTNYSASDAPDVNDDTTAGYRVGSRWIDLVGNQEYVCVDSTAGSAVWVETTVGGGSVSQLADLSDVGAAVDTANFVLATPNLISGVYSGRALVGNDIPGLAASKITSGTFDTARIPSLDASIITTGTFSASQIPSLDAAKIGTGTLADARISETSVTQHEAALTILTSQLSGTAAHENGGLEADVSAYDGAVHISGGVTSAIKHNYAAITAPGTTDDTGSGYSIGSIWFDIANDKIYGCVDATASAATWVDLSEAGGGATDHGTLVGLGDDDHTQYLLADATRASSGIQEFLGVNMTDSVEKTIASGAITYTQMFMRVDTQGDVSSDDLDTISGGSAGDIAVIYPESGVRTVVLKGDGSGNITTFDGNDISLDTAAHVAILFFDGTNWKVIANSAGGGATNVILFDDTYINQYSTSSGLTQVATTGLTVGDMRFLQHANNATTTDEESEGVSAYQLVSATLGSKNISSINTTSDVITTTSSHSWETGQGVIVRSTASIPPGITENQLYFIRDTGTSTLTLHDTRLGASNNSARVNITGSGSGTITLYEANYPHEVVPDDYDASTNTRYWRRTELDPIICQHVDILGPSEALTSSTAYFGLIVGCSCVLERISLACPYVTDGSPTISVYVNGAQGFRAGGVFLNTTGTSGTGSEVSNPAQYSLDRVTDFTDDLRQLTVGDVLEVYVDDDGSASGTAAQGLSMTIWYRPVRRLVTIT